MGWKSGGSSTFDMEYRREGFPPPKSKQMDSSPCKTKQKKPTHCIVRELLLLWVTGTIYIEMTPQDPSAYGPIGEGIQFLSRPILRGALSILLLLPPKSPERGKP